MDLLHLSAHPVSSADDDLLADLDWPVRPTLETLGQAIAESCALRIRIMPIPDDLRHQEISGLTTIAGTTAYVFFATDLSPINREATIMHEFAHILHRDVSTDQDRTHMRSQTVFDDPVEKRAEKTGMRLLEMLHQHQQNDNRHRNSELFDFLSGHDRDDRANPR